MSGNQEFEERLMNIEMALANQERMLDDLNQVVIEQGKLLTCCKSKASICWRIWMKKRSNR